MLMKILHEEFAAEAVDKIQTLYLYKEVLGGCVI